MTQDFGFKTLLIHFRIKLADLMFLLLDLSNAVDVRMWKKLGPDMPEKTGFQNFDALAEKGVMQKKVSGLAFCRKRCQVLPFALEAYRMPL